MKQNSESVKAGFVFILPACFYGSFWATVPLIGWGEYTREPGSRHRCTAVASLTSTHVHRYTYALLLFCFVLPVIIIGYCCYYVLLLLYTITIVAISVIIYFGCMDSLCINCIFVYYITKRFIGGIGDGSIFCQISGCIKSHYLRFMLQRFQTVD